MTTPPPRTAGHVKRDAIIQQFADAGLVPVISTNGSNPEADIQQAKGPQPGEVVDAWITARGERRLDAAAPTLETREALGMTRG